MEIVHRCSLAENVQYRALIEGVLDFPMTKNHISCALVAEIRYHLQSEDFGSYTLAGGNHFRLQTVHV